MKVKYVIEGKFPTLNEYIYAERSNAMQAASLKKKYTRSVHYQILAGGVKKIDGLVDVDIYWITPNKKTDSDNVFFAVKFILDGLTSAGVIMTDGRKNIRNISHHIRVCKGKNIAIVSLRSVG